MNEATQEQTDFIQGEFDSLAKYLASRGLPPTDSTVLMAATIGHAVRVNTTADEREQALAQLERVMRGAAGMERKAH